MPLASLLFLHIALLQFGRGRKKIVTLCVYETINALPASKVGMGMCKQNGPGVILAPLMLSMTIGLLCSCTQITKNRSPNIKYNYTDFATGY